MWQIFLGNLGVGAQTFECLAGFFVDQVVREHLADEVFIRHLELFDARFFHLPYMLGVYATACFDDDILAVFQIKTKSLAAQATGHQRQAGFGFGHSDLVSFKEGVQDVFRGVAQRTQDDRCRQLSTTVDTSEHAVFGIKLEVEPRATVGDNPGGEQELA